MPHQQQIHDFLVDHPFAGAWLGQLDLLHDERPAELLEHCGANLHGRSLAHGRERQPNIVTRSGA
jgi:hypothetical protein